MIEGKIVSKRNIYVVTIVIQDTTTFECLYLINTKEGISIREERSFRSIKDLAGYLKKKTSYVVLNISGRGTLHKTTQLTNTYKEEVLFGKPAATFVFYEYRSYQKVFVSFIKKETVDGYIELLNAYRIYVVCLTVGGFGAASLDGLLKTNEVETPFQSIMTTGQGHITDFNTTQNTRRNYFIENEPISNINIAGLASAIHWLQPNDCMVTEESITLLQQRNLYQLLWFEFLKKFTLVVFFIIALFSWLGQKYVMQQQKNYEQQYNLNKGRYEQIEKLSSYIQQKESIIRLFGSMHTRYIANYIHDICRLVPTGITLTKLNAFPLKSAKENTEPVVIDNELIVVYGLYSQKNSLNNWLYALKKMNWVAQLTIVSVQEHTFLIEIKI